MPAPVRFPSGVNNATSGGNANSLMRNYPAPDPTRLHEWFDHFDNYTAADWTITETGTGTRAVSAGGDGGLLVVTNGASDDDANFLQYSGATSSATVETFKFVAGKQLWFKARFKVSDATQSDFVMGLQITDTTPLAVSDGVYWRKDDGDANLDFVQVVGSAATTATAASTCSDDTFMVLGFYYDGKGSLEYFKDDVKLGTSTTAITAEELTVSFGVQNGEAVAKVMTVDYILASKDS